MDLIMMFCPIKTTKSKKIHHQTIRGAGGGAGVGVNGGGGGGNQVLASEAAVALQVANHNNAHLGAGGGGGGGYQNAGGLSVLSNGALANNGNSADKQPIALSKYRYVTAEFQAEAADELNVLPGDAVIYEYSDTDAGTSWSHVLCLKSGKQGFVPSEILSLEPVRNCKKKLPRSLVDSIAGNHHTNHHTSHLGHHHNNNHHTGHQHGPAHHGSHHLNHSPNHHSPAHHHSNHHGAHHLNHHSSHHHTASHHHSNHNHHHHQSPNGASTGQGLNGTGHLHKTLNPAHLHHQSPGANGHMTSSNGPLGHNQANNGGTINSTANLLPVANGASLLHHNGTGNQHHHQVISTQPSLNGDNTPQRSHLHRHVSELHQTPTNFLLNAVPSLHGSSINKQSFPRFPDLRALNSSGGYYNLRNSEPAYEHYEMNFSPFQRDMFGLYIVITNFCAREENDLSVKPGEFVTVLNKDDPDWNWVRRECDHMEGFVPARFLCDYEQVKAILNKGNSTVTMKSSNHLDRHTYINHKPDRESLTTDQHSSSFQHI